MDIYPLSKFVSRVRALSAIPGSQPLSVAYMTRTETHRRVRDLLDRNDYDLIVCYSSQVAAYLPADLDVPVVMDLVDVDSEKFAAYGEERSGLSGFVPRLEARRLRSFEADIGQSCAKVVLTTPREVAVYRERVGKGDVVSISNGIVLPDVVRPQADRDPELAVFVGTMNYDPNVAAVVYAADHVWPKVLAERPNARLRIVGRSPGRRVQELSKRPGIEVTGEVPDLIEHLGEAAMSIIPLHIARGIQNKTLEALAAGLPLVSTEAVLACLHEGAEDAVETASTPDEFAAGALRLMADPELRQRRGDAGRAYVARYHDWSRLDEAWGRVFDEVMALA